MRKIFLSLLPLLAFSVLKGQETYSLGDCIKIGLENNYSLILARNQETISENNYTRGNAGYLPSLTLSSYSYKYHTDTWQDLADGTNSNTLDANSMLAYAELDFDLTLFDGFLVKTTYKKLGELHQLGKLNTQLEVENFVANLASAYYNYVQQLQLFHNLEYALDLSRERIRIDQERYLLGSGSKLELLQSKVYFNSDSSRLVQQNDVLRTLEIKLNEMMAVKELARNVEISDSTIQVSKDLDFETLQEQTLSGNTSLQIALHNLTVSEYDKKIVASQAYPYLTFTSEYDRYYYKYWNNTVDNKQIGTTFLGLTFGMNVFDGFNQRREMKNALIALENKELTYEQTEQGVMADLLTIYHGYENNLRLLELEKQNLETATENLDIAMERYKLGNLSGLELREVQLSLLDAEERLLSVQYEAKIAEISLLQISGRINEYF